MIPRVIVCWSRRILQRCGPDSPRVRFDQSNRGLKHGSWCVVGNPQHWPAEDAEVIENGPECSGFAEAINTLDDYVLDGFIEQFAESFSPAQAKAVVEFRDAVDRYCGTTPQDLDAKKVLADPAWEIIRNKASDFITAFKGSWPNSTA